MNEDDHIAMGMPAKDFFFQEYDKTGKRPATKAMQVQIRMIMSPALVARQLSKVEMDMAFP